jgi:hypothetical protein
MACLAVVAVAFDGSGGRELFYVTPADPIGKRRMMAVDFLPSSSPPVGAPRVLFEFDPLELAFTCMPMRCYDVAPDGQHFYAVRTPALPPPPSVTHINLIQNWFEELKAKVPTAKQ